MKKGKSWKQWKHWKKRGKVGNNGGNGSNGKNGKKWFLEMPLGATRTRHLKNLIFATWNLR